MVGMVLLLNALASSPALHEWFHSDATESGHQCAVTLFAHGQVDSVSIDLPVAAPLPLIESVSPIQISLFGSALENLPAGRAPPVSSLIS
jgi:hypothetical protein